MGDIVNLRQRRKQAARAEQDKTAAENRARFGRAKAEKRQEQAERTRSERALDRNKLDDQ